jgi:lambda repressor-like predicted transcriptional regulator
MATIETIDELIDYLEEKGISPYQLSKESGYSRSHVRNCVMELSIPTPDTLEILIEAALNIGEKVTFSRVELSVIRKVLTVDREGYLYTLKPDSMSESQWKDFLGKLL